MTLASTLPERITPLTKNEKQKCRIVWKIIATGYTCHGRWFTLFEEAMLKSTIADMNLRYVDEKTHWIEYK